MVVGLCIVRDSCWFVCVLSEIVVGLSVYCEIWLLIYLCIVRHGCWFVSVL